MSPLLHHAILQGEGSAWSVEHPANVRLLLSRFRQNRTRLRGRRLQKKTNRSSALSWDRPLVIPQYAGDTLCSFRVADRRILSRHVSSLTEKRKKRTQLFLALDTDFNTVNNLSLPGPGRGHGHRRPPSIALDQQRPDHRRLQRRNQAFRCSIDSEHPMPRLHAALPRCHATGPGSQGRCRPQSFHIPLVSPSFPQPIF